MGRLDLPDKRRDEDSADDPVTAVSESGVDRAAAEPDFPALLARAAYVAEHLMQMIDRETWRSQGAEWMGQYEGDHWEEQTAQEIESWKQLAL